MSKNPFAPRPDFKKRVVAVSLTEDQHNALLELQKMVGADSLGAVVKLALEQLYDRNQKLDSMNQMKFPH